MLAVMVKLESIAPSSICTVRTTSSVVELVALSEATALAACRPHPSCSWTGLVLQWVSGFHLVALWNGSMKITSKNLWNLYQPSKNSGPSELHSGVHLTHWQQTEDFRQTSAS